MATHEFQIPLSPQDLEPSEGVSKTYVLAGVRSFEDSGSAEEALDKVTDAVLNAPDIFTAVLDHAVFDQAYSLIKCVCVRMRACVHGSCLRAC
jgi:hypothetical protein